MIYWSTVLMMAKFGHETRVNPQGLYDNYFCSVDFHILLMWKFVRQRKEN
jgi:hypothetical protein